MASLPLSVAERTSGGLTIVELGGRLDASQAGECEGRLLPLADTGARLVVDCHRLEYISSAGLRVIVLLLKRLQAQNGRLVLCRVGPFVGQVLEMTGFTRLVPVCSGLDEALALAAGSDRAPAADRRED